MYRLKTAQIHLRRIRYTLFKNTVQLVFHCDDLVRLKLEVLCQAKM